MDFFKKQILWGAIGLIVFFLVSFVDYRIFKNHSLVIVVFYLIAVILLVILLIVDFKVRGAASWIRIANINFQPAEFVKIILVLLLAKYFSLRHIALRHP